VITCDFREDLAQWEVHDPTAALATWNGRPAIHLSRGQPVLLAEPVLWESYAVEADVATEGRHGYVGFAFGARDALNFELVSIYPVNAEGDGEVQYDASIHGSQTWQVYHQPAYRRPGIKMAPGEWVHLKVVVRPDQAEVYLGDATEPHLIISPLMFGRPTGTVGLWGYCPTYVSQFRVTPVVEASAAAPVKAPLPAGTVARWEVSDRVGASAVWRQVPVEENGTLCLNRLYAMNQGYAVAYARTAVESASEREALISVGFSDKLRLSVNGAEVLSAESRWNPPHDDGRIRAGTRTVKVWLKPGANEILAEVQCTEPPFGWGLALQII